MQLVMVVVSKDINAAGCVIDQVVERPFRQVDRAGAIIPNQPARSRLVHESLSRQIPSGVFALFEKTPPLAETSLAHFESRQKARFGGE